VKSFVTDVESERSETVKGGSWVHCGVPISAGGYNCVPSNSYIAACEALSINYCDTFNQIQ
jgi:hypothetical protein